MTPRAPKGYVTLKDGRILKKATALPGRICLYSGHPVTDTQRHRKSRDCPRCGAPEIPWEGSRGEDYAEIGKVNRYLNKEVWGRHQTGEGMHPALFELDVEITESKAAQVLQYIEEVEDDAPF